MNQHLENYIIVVKNVATHMFFCADSEVCMIVLTGWIDLFIRYYVIVIPVAVEKLPQL